MSQDRTVIDQENLKAVSNKHIVISRCCFVAGLFAMYRGSAEDRNWLILGGLVLFLLAYLSKQVGTLYSTVATLSGEMQMVKASPNESGT